MWEKLISSRWNIMIPKSRNNAYNQMRLRWVEAARTREEAETNAACECEDCGTSLVGQPVVETPYEWLCLVCAESQGYYTHESRYTDAPDRHEVDDVTFADPGGRSALRAATPDNPRDQPCPSCGRTNVLTAADRQQGYQCDRCADQAERGGW